MRYLGYPLLLLFLGLLMAGIFALLGVVSGNSSAPMEPAGVSMQFNFGGTRTVLFCWVQVGTEDVTSYDARIQRWNFGLTRTEVVHRLSTVDCAEGIGASHVFVDDNLYHVSLRSCRNNLCSGWVDASEQSAYWFQVPCPDPSGKSCTHPAVTDSPSSQAPAR